MKNQRLPLTCGAVVAAATLAFASSPTVVRAQTDSTTTTTNSAGSTSMNQGSMNENASKLDWSDRRFLTKVAKGNAEEIALSRAAADRATNPQVKDFAQKMVTDHTELGNDLMALASSKGETLPSMEKEDKMTDKWEKKSGKDFDDSYIKEMIDGHEDMIDLMVKGAKSDDADISAFARKYQTTVEEHYSMAKMIKKNL